MLRAIGIFILAVSVATAATIAFFAGVFLAFAWNQVVFLLFAVAMLGVIVVTVNLAVRGLEEPQPWKGRVPSG